MTTRSNTAVEAAVDATTTALLARQRGDGSWQDQLPSAAVATGVAISALHAARHFLSQQSLSQQSPGAHGTAELRVLTSLIAGGAAWLREQQGPDGGWGDAPGAPATLNATAIADAALRLVEPRSPLAEALAVEALPVEALPIEALPIEALLAEALFAQELTQTLARSQDWLDRHGGRAAVEDRTRCTLGLIVVNILAAAGAYPIDRLGRLPYELILLPRPLRQKLSFTVPGLMSFGLMHAELRRRGPLRRAVNRAARRSAVTYLAEVQRYEDTTGISLSTPVGGYQESALMTGVVCFGLSRSGLAADPTVTAIVRRCVRFLTTTVRPDGSWPVNRDLEFSASMFCLHGLLDAGHGADPRLAATYDLIVRSQRRQTFAPTGSPPGSWGWSLPSGWPNTDDTATAVLSLAALGAAATPQQSAALSSGAAWLVRMQNRDGSWGCFTRNAPTSLDAPCGIFTAHAGLALYEAGMPITGRPITRALNWLRRAQRPDGSMPGLWYRPYTSSTGAVLQTLGRLGLAGEPTADGCRRWLLAHQNADGGWGDGQGSESTPEETAWAVLGLVDAAGTQTEAVRAAAGRGVDWLISAQRSDGLWEPTLLGVYFLNLMYHDDLICAGYALQALGRFHTWSGGRS